MTVCSSCVFRLTLQLLIVAWAQHVEDCPAAHEGGLKGSGGTGRVLHPSQCIYSYTPPFPSPHPSPPSRPLFSVTHPSRVQFSSSSSGKIKGVKCVCGWVWEGSVCFLCTHSHICDWLTVGLPATTIDLSHLFRWRRPCGKDFRLSSHALRSSALKDGWVEGITGILQRLPLMMWVSPLWSHQCRHAWVAPPRTLDRIESWTCTHFKCVFSHINLTAYKWCHGTKSILARVQCTLAGWACFVTPTKTIFHELIYSDLFILDSSCI